MVTPRLPESARPAPRPGPTTSGGWSQPYQRPPWAPMTAPLRTGAPQALAADPGPLPFAPSRRPAPAPSRARRAAVVVLVVVLALAGLAGGYAAARLIGGQPPFSVSLAPDGPVVDGERMVSHSDDNARYSGTGMGFTALVPSTWQQFRLQQPGGDIVVRYVSDDAERELRIDRLVRFYPTQRAAAYAALLAEPDPTRGRRGPGRAAHGRRTATARGGGAGAADRLPRPQRHHRRPDHVDPAGPVRHRSVGGPHDRTEHRAGRRPQQFAVVADSFTPPV